MMSFQRLTIIRYVVMIIVPTFTEKAAHRSIVFQLSNYLKSFSSTNLIIDTESTLHWQTYIHTYIKIYV